MCNDDLTSEAASLPTFEEVIAAARNPLADAARKILQNDPGAATPFSAN